MKLRQMITGTKTNLDKEEPGSLVPDTKYRGMIRSLLYLMRLAGLILCSTLDYVHISNHVQKNLI